eukprot:sb/3470728/
MDSLGRTWWDMELDHMTQCGELKKIQWELLHEKNTRNVKLGLIQFSPKFTLGFARHILSGMPAFSHYFRSLVERGDVRPLGIFKNPYFLCGAEIARLGGSIGWVSSVNYLPLGLPRIFPPEAALVSVVSGFKGVFSKAHVAGSTRRENARKSTELSKHVWDLKDTNTDFTLQWKVIDRGHPPNGPTQSCDLCTTEKN